MQVYDTANRLAQEIKDSEEYKAYKKLKDEIHNDFERKQKVEEFEKLRYEIQLMTYAGKEQNQEKTKKLEEMYRSLIESKDIKEYFDLEVKFNVMIADVNKIIAEAIKDVL
ncbi:MAG: YlbF family regulator [Clostridia bacterium]|nr:YlbF family regulator [Clostridia bacterium]